MRGRVGRIAFQLPLPLIWCNAPQLWCNALQLWCNAAQRAARRKGKVVVVVGDTGAVQGGKAEAGLPSRILAAAKEAGAAQILLVAPYATPGGGGLFGGGGPTRAPGTLPPPSKLEEVRFVRRALFSLSLGTTLPPGGPRCRVRFANAALPRKPRNRPKICSAALLGFWDPFCQQSWYR